VNARVAGLGVALALLVALDVLIARVDLFTPLRPKTHPLSLGGAINTEVIDVLRALYHPPPAPPVILLGNSQMNAATHPLHVLRQNLVARGLAPERPLVLLTVLATVPTDQEVLARRLTPLLPGLVLVGIAPPDVGTPVERARQTGLTRVLDTGFRDGLVPPADAAARLDRWVRTAWLLYRYRTLFYDLFLPPPGYVRHEPGPEALRTRAGILTMLMPDRAAELIPLYTRFEQTQRYEDFLRYVEGLRGPDYLRGLRDRWRGLEPQAVQLVALRRTAEHVRGDGGRQAWILMPENPLFRQDPEVGPELGARSDAAAAAVRREAAASDVPLIDLRDALPSTAFVDLNHVDYSGPLFPILAAALADRHLLDGP
jgi:hypothetical protein